MFGNMKSQLLQMNSEKQESLLKLSILTIASVLSFSTRLFSVLRFESVIHEFDPYFNYRTTQYLADEGFYKFHNWFDERAWYPLGRIIGGTIYPGLMLTASILYHAMNFLHISIDVRNVCVFLAPLFSSFTTIVTYLLTKELKDTGAGLVAAAMISIVPGYISRSVAGSYDNEGIAIFLYAAYLLLVDQISQNRIFTMGCFLFSGILLHGIFLGRLRLSHQLDSSSCVNLNFDWSLFSSYLRCL